MKEQYDITIKLLKELAAKNECAMVLCHSIGYNGFKRWHRRRIKKFNRLAIGLTNELFDNYRKVPNVTAISSMYSVNSLQEHLAAWDHELEKAIITLTDNSKKFFELSGKINCFIDKAICRLVKDREKVRRWYARMAEGNWSSHDMHYVDDYLHKKEKKREGKKHAG